MPYYITSRLLLQYESKILQKEDNISQIKSKITQKKEIFTGQLCV